MRFQEQKGGAWRCMSRLALAAVVGMLMLTGAPRLATADGEATLRQQAKQGIHYYRKKRWNAAMAALEKARAMPGGAEDYATLYHLARVYYVLLHLEKAMPIAAAAVEAAADPKEKAESTRLLKTLRSRFGGVTFRMAKEQEGQIEEGLIHLEDRGGLINPQKKQVFAKIAERFRETPVKLPITLYLPFGSYAANRAPFEVQPDAVAEVELILYNPNQGISPWWFVGGAAVVVAATATVVALVVSSEPPEDTQDFRLEPVRFLPAPSGAGEGGE